LLSRFLFYFYEHVQTITQQTVALRNRHEAISFVLFHAQGPTAEGMRARGRELHWFAKFQDEEDTFTFDQGFRIDGGFPCLQGVFHDLVNETGLVHED